MSEWPLPAASVVAENCSCDAYLRSRLEILPIVSGSRGASRVLDSLFWGFASLREQRQ